MKKSLFSRFSIAFLSIILISFTLLGFVMTLLISRYMVSERRDDLRDTTKALGSFFDQNYADSGISDFNRFVFNHHGYTVNTLSAVAPDPEKMLVLIFDSKGDLIAENTEGMDLHVKPELLDTIDGGEPVMTDLGGTFSGRRFCCLTTVCTLDDGYSIPVGYVLVVCPGDTISGLVTRVLRTVFLSVIWVMLAAVLVVFLVTRRVSNPLRQMSRAAKSYAAGKFDVRVPVSGSDEIAELATAFNAMATSLQNFENMRSSFLSNVSHELRTPMTSISGFIDGILSGAIPEEKQPYYLGIVADEVRRLSRLVNSLLDISRIQAGDRKFVPTAFDICEMARQILISFEKKIDEKHLDVEFDAPEEKLMVYADRDAIYQVLYNICHNAVKFSSDRGKYRITIEERDRLAYVSVFNEGVGIEPEELPLVFDRFYKSDKSRGIDKMGVGLGMYITKTIMDAHGQQIWVKSKYGENCEFTFTLQTLTE